MGPTLLSKVAERDRETEQRAEKLEGEKRRQVGPFILRFRGKRARLNLLQIDAPFSLSFQTFPKMPTLDRYDRSRFDTFLVQEVKKVSSLESLFLIHYFQRKLFLVSLDVLRLRQVIPRCLFKEICPRIGILLGRSRNVSQIPGWP